MGMIEHLNGFKFSQIVSCNHFCEIGESTLS